MFHYLFTNDLRISNLEEVLIEAAKCFLTDSVPSASENKNANNNMNTLGFYFNLTKESKCAKECAAGNVRKVVLNFIKKFQFPNPRQSGSLKDCIDDGIMLAPMRIVLQILYMMKINHSLEAYLTKKEILDNIFMNEDVAKNSSPDLYNLINKIIKNRSLYADQSIPNNDDVLEKKGLYWKQCKRQLREMVKVLCWSGCVIENDDGSISIRHNNLSRDNEADLFEIITYSKFWEPDRNKNAEGNKGAYQKYMDIEETIVEKLSPEEELISLDNKEFIFKCLNIMKELNLFNRSSLTILQSKAECAVKFKHNSTHGILYKIDKSKSAEEEAAQMRGANGRTIYYNDRYVIGNDVYLVSSDWSSTTGTENPKEHFYRWIFSLIRNLKTDILPSVFQTAFSQRFITSLLAKPFVILTGNSGTGKTRIARNFAKYMEVMNKNGKRNWLIVPVGADWTDNIKVLGFYNPLADNGEGKYEKTRILELIERANQNKYIPFFLVLDEMNLSHVERYFSDFLSHMERTDSEFELDGYERKVRYPDNLFVVGTVNIDETTYMFSPKVLDRANVIEFKPDKKDVMNLFNAEPGKAEIEPAGAGVAVAFLKLSREIRNGKSDVLNDPLVAASDKVTEIFSKLYDITEKQGFEFAFRTVREIKQYISVAYELQEDKSMFDLDKTIDEQIVQKILPKIHGNKKEIGELLAELKALCPEDKMPLSFNKIDQMERKLSTVQYASFI